MRWQKKIKKRLQMLSLATLSGLLEARRSFTLKYQQIFFFLLKIMTLEKSSVGERYFLTSLNGPCFMTVSVCLGVCVPE